MSALPCPTRKGTEVMGSIMFRAQAMKPDYDLNARCHQCRNCGRAFENWFVRQVAEDDLCRDCAELWYAWCDECQAWWRWYGGDEWRREYRHSCGDKHECTRCGQVAPLWGVPEGFWCEQCMAAAKRLVTAEQDVDFDEFADWRY